MVGRPSKAGEQRQRILAGAADIFSRRGYRGTSMNEIAATVQLSKPTLYHYFRNKEEILIRLYEDVMEQSIKSARDIESSIDEPLKALHDLIAYRVAFTCENQAIHKVFFEEEEELPAELVHTVIGKRREFEDIMKGIVRRHLASLTSPPDLAVTVYVNTCLGAANWVYKWYDPDGGMSPSELGDQIADLLLRPLAEPAVPSPPRLGLSYKGW